MKKDGSCVMWIVLIAIIPAVGPLPLILYWLYLKFSSDEPKNNAPVTKTSSPSKSSKQSISSKNLPFDMDNKRFENMESYTKYIAKKSSFKVSIEESHYKDYLTEKKGPNGDMYMYIIFPLKKFDLTVEVLFLNDFTGVIMYVLTEIPNKLASEIYDICDAVNEKIVLDEEKKHTCNYSYGFGYKNGNLFGYFPTNEGELEGDTLYPSETIRIIDKLIYYAETELMPRMEKKFGKL